MFKNLKVSIPLIALILVSCAGDISSLSTQSNSLNTYTVLFDSQGGSYVPSQTVEPNSFISTPNISKEGHTLEGWYTSLNGGISYEKKWIFFTDRVNSSFTLFASWTINQYTLTFDSNGGTNVPSVTDNYGENLNILTPIKVGYTFAGWFTDAGLTQLFTMNTMPASNLMLFAKWTIKQYTITFETNGGSTIASITGNYGDAVSFANDPTRQGYTFIGWYADINLTEAATIPNTIPAQNLILYAQWTINQYTLTFDSNGGTNVPSVTDNYGENLNILTPIKVGYTFAGWFTDAGLTQLFTMNTMPASNLMLFAKWTIKQYTITFETNGGSSLQTQTYNYNDILSLPNTTKVGHTFSGWFTDLSLTQAFTLSTMPDSNLTLFAKWMIIWESLSLGRNHSSALSATNQVFIWGSNQYGILDGSTLSNINIPTDITSRFSLDSSDKIISLSLGGYHSSVLTSNGRVFTWGSNSYGALGKGESSMSFDAYEITHLFSLESSDKITSLSMGGYHSSALSANGRVFMWGLNNAGQLGNGTTTNRNIPTEITSRFSIESNDKIISLSLGSSHSSALTANGRVFMWGANSLGNLGNGTTTNRNIPTEITSRFSIDSNDKIISLSMGESHSSALTANGRVFMWGNNGDGQLGDASITNRNVPTEITSNFSLESSDKITSLPMGLFHSSALSANGRVFMWGLNNAGQLGNGTTTNRNIPTEITSRFSVESNDKIISLSLGASHSSALTANGRVFMWGQNYFGELGNNTTNDSNVPIMI